MLPDKQLWCFNTTNTMWLPVRSSSVPSHSVNGYSINQVTGERFPALGQYANYQFAGYESFFEALDSATESESTDILTLNFLPKKKGTWDTFNFVQHYKRDVSIVDSQFSFASRESGIKWRNFGIPVLSFWDENYCALAIEPYLAFGPAEIPILGLPNLWMGQTGGVFHSIGGLFETACSKVLPGIRPVNSLINSIYELKDVKTIPRTINSILNGLAHLESLSKADIRYLFKDRHKRGLKTFKAIMNAGADIYLQGNFNIAPLLKDIANLYLQVRTVDNKLKQLVAHAAQPIRAHWGANLTEFRSSDETLSTHGRPSDEDSQVSLRRVVKHDVARFQATIEYSYRMPEGSYNSLLFAGTLDYNGLVLSPQVIWNGLPWTFVLDWVLGVSPWLSQFTGRHLDIVTHISKAGWSVKVVRNVNISSSLTGPVGTCREESYYRTPANVPLINSLHMSGVSSKEFSLGVALGITQGKVRT